MTERLPTWVQDWLGTVLPIGEVLLVLAVSWRRPARTVHRLGITIDAHHVVPQLHQGVGHGTAKAPQTDHDHTVTLREGELLCK